MITWVKPGGLMDMPLTNNIKLSAALKLRKNQRSLMNIPLCSSRKRSAVLCGMTLIEVTVGMAIIIIVTVIAYMGVSASANFSQRGVDLRNADGPAVSMLEEARNKVENPAEGVAASVTEVQVKYDVNQIVYSQVAGEADVTAVVTNVIKDDNSVDAELIEAEYNDIEYQMYLPKK